MRYLAAIAILLLIAYLGRELGSKRSKFKTIASLFGTGYIFCAIGAALGPQGLNVLSADTRETLEPGVYFLLGWIGFLIGMQGEFKLLRQVPRPMMRFLVGRFVALFLIGALAYVAIGLWVAVDLFNGIIGGLLLAALATASSQSVAQLAGDVSGRDNSMLLRIVSGLDDFPVMYVVLFIISALAVGSDGGGGFGGWEYTLLHIVEHILLGGAFGLAFLLFTRVATKKDETLAVSLGLLFMASGTAQLLTLAAPVVGFIAGHTLINLSIPKKETFYGVLKGAERPVVLLMLLSAGSYLEISSPWWLFAPVIWLLIRSLSTVVVGSLLVRYALDPKRFTRHIGWGMISLGPIAIAVALEFYLITRNAAGEASEMGKFVLWTIVAGALLSELLAYPGIKRVESGLAELKAAAKAEREAEPASAS